MASKAFIDHYFLNTLGFGVFLIFKVKFKQFRLDTIIDLKMIIWVIIIVEKLSKVHIGEAGLSIFNSKNLALPKAKINIQVQPERLLFYIKHLGYHIKLIGRILALDKLLRNF